MAVFGFQLFLTIIVLSLLNKLSNKFSLARWLFTKGSLVRYLHPSNEQLKEAIAQQNRSYHNGFETTNNDNRQQQRKQTWRQRKQNRKTQQNNQEQITERFNVPRNVTLSLDAEPLNMYYMIQLPYYNDLQWLIDFAFCSVLVYFITEVYQLIMITLVSGKVSSEYNLSVVWCLLSLMFIIKILFSITATYFRGQESIGERSMCIVSFCFFLLLSMVILIVDDEKLEFGLVDSYKKFQANAMRLLKEQGAIENASGPTSFLMIKFWLAIMCALIGAVLIFPGMRVARMHLDALEYAGQNRSLTILYHISFISPLVICLFWIKPLARYFLVTREWPSRRGTLLSDETFESARLCSILLILVLRLSLFRKYLQAYLNIAPQKLIYMRKQCGKITNVDFQKLIARVSHYLCVASLQYLAPVLMCLFMVMITKSLGEYRWIASINSINSSQAMSDDSIQPLASSNHTDRFSFNKIAEQSSENNITSDEIQNTAKITMNLLRDVFSGGVLRGFINFLLWWTCSVWFFTSVIGFIYHSYFKTTNT